MKYLNIYFESLKNQGYTIHGPEIFAGVVFGIVVGFIAGLTAVKFIARLF